MGDQERGCEVEFKSEIVIGAAVGLELVIAVLVINFVLAPSDHLNSVYTIVKGAIHPF